MARIDDTQRKAIQAAIELAEAGTSAEFVTVVGRSAELYLFIPSLAAAIGALFLSGIALMFQPQLGFTTTEFYGGQVALFVVLVSVCKIPAIRFSLVPKSIRHARASRLARQMFLELGMTESEDRNAVLLFVALGERYVEIIADAGLQAKLSDTSVWDGVVARFVGQVRQGRIADGFVSAIEGCADVMAEHFPNREGAENRYPDRLIEL